MGTRFNVHELLKQSEKRYNDQIAELEAQIVNLEQTSIDDRHKKWRDDAEQAVLRLSDRVYQASDAELCSFSIGDPPRPNEYRYTIQDKNRRTQSLSADRDKVLSYIRSLHAEDGVVDLATADLRRIGYPL